MGAAATIEFRDVVYRQPGGAPVFDGLTLSVCRKVTPADLLAVIDTVQLVVPAATVAQAPLQAPIELPPVVFAVSFTDVLMS